jgi:hypothetical protein
MAKEFKRIIVPIDGSAVAKRALRKFYPEFLIQSQASQRSLTYTSGSMP